MADSTKVWISTQTIDTILHPPTAGGGHHKRLGMHGSLGGQSNDLDVDSHIVNWGWTSAFIVSGGHSGDDGALDGKSDVKIQVEDAESEYNRLEIVVPGKAIEEGKLVMQNYHGDDSDDDSMCYDSDEDDGRPKVNFDGEEAQGYPDDLITLTHLHEPAVVHCLRKRYERDKIYTNTGPILIALNPFKRCNNLYSDKVMKQYWEKGEAQMLMGGSGDAGAGSGGGKKKGGDEEQLSPHVYDLADATYRSMMLKMDVEGGGGGRGSKSSSGGGGNGCDQSILVSGESGAGKTVTTKFIMQYLATLSERRAESKNGTSSGKSTPKKKAGGGRASLKRENSSDKVNIEQQVLQSNPILESFGNARTVRNDNSSRFGKFIEIRFTAEGTLVGASIETYLLEKVRLISQTSGERNYHVFYEMLSGMTDEDLDRLKLGEYNSAEDFKITSCSGTYDRRDGIQDSDTYEDLVDALEVMGFSTDQSNDVFSIASAMLHLSNLTINPIKGGEECEIDLENDHLEPVLQLLGVTKENLNQAICYFKIEARGQSYTRAVQKDKAEKGLEALIKATYSAMFDYIVKTINSSITVKKKTGEGGGKEKRSSRGDSGSAVIGVLDIFGFESFKTNSFEQLCINYCNEALQQQFNLFVLKNEQEEYEQEGIKWSFISFPDNQDALDLIWKKGYGILNILDDQCRAPGTTDKTFANDLYQKLTNKPRFEANFRQVGARQFGVFHYAGLVEYDTDGFVEKNKDELPREATDLLLSSSSKFVKELAAIISSSSAPEPTKSSVRGGKKKMATVGGHFASQLQSLRAKIDLTSPHYVRCLKPNGELVPDNFDPLMIVEQLRCAGVVEAVRVSRVGYPQRYNHSQFVSRYRTLGLREMKKAAKPSSRKVKPVVVLVDTIAKKMVEIMEKSSSTGAASSPTNKKDKKSSSGKEKVDLLAVGIQVGKTKVFLRRRAFDILEKMRKDYMATAAIKVQAIARGYVHYRNFNERSDANLRLQCWLRVILAERRVQVERERFNAQRIQSMYRQHRARISYIAVLAVAKWCQRHQRGKLGRARYKQLNKLRQSAIVIQCMVRIRRAHSQLNNLKNQAKDLQNVALERDKFRERMEEMRIEMERVKKAAKKEAKENAARLKKEASERDESDNAARGDIQEELDRVKEELASVRKSLEEEQQRAEEARELAETREEELEEARESISRLESELEEAKAEASSNDAGSSALADIDNVPMDSNQMLLQNKLDEALATARKREKEIKRLKGELSDALENASRPPPQSAAESGTSNVSSDENDALKIEVSSLKSELEATKKQLSTALEATKMQLSMAQNSGTNGDVNDIGSSQQHKDMQNQIATLKKELAKAKKKVVFSSQDAGETSEYTSLASEVEANKLREENKRLRDELDQALAKQSDVGAATEPPSKSSSSSSEKKMKKEIAKLKEANKKILETAEQQFSSLTDLTKENADLRSEIEKLRDGNDSERTNSGPGAPVNDANSYEDIKTSLARAEARAKAEKARAEEAVAREAKLRTEMAEMRLKSSTRSNGNSGGGNLTHQSISEEGELDDIATLQYEVERLSNELLVAKEEARSTDTFSADDMIRKYDELKRMAEAGMQKDLEIEKLKLRVNTQDAELKSLREEVTEEDLTFGVRDYNKEGDSDIAAAENEGLRSLNDELTKQLDLYIKESEEAKTKLKEEKSRSEMEMKAFSMALKGVDDLRVAAEHMSRELHIIKKNGYIPPGGVTGEDSSEAIKNAMSAVESMARANQSIDHPSISDDSSVLSARQQQGSFNLWKAMNAVMSPGQVEAMHHVTEATGGLFNEKTAAASSSKKSSSKHKSKRRKKRSDSGSIISSFF